MKWVNKVHFIGYFRDHPCNRGTDVTANTEDVTCLICLAKLKQKILNSEVSIDIKWEAIKKLTT